MTECISVIIAIAALGLSVISYITGVLHDRKQSTLDAYNQLQEQVLDKLNLYTLPQIKEILQNSKSEDYKILGCYVARVEHFCVGVNKKIYDKKTLYNLAHGYFDGSFQNKINAIIAKRNKNPKEDYYKNTAKVLKWMNKMNQKRRMRGHNYEK